MAAQDLVMFEIPVDERAHMPVREVLVPSIAI
jgi:hypothetical protein